MAAQLNYGYSIPKGIAGGKADLSYDDVVTRSSEDGKVKFGLAVQTGTKAGIGVKLPASGATKDKIEGVAVYAANIEQDMDGNVVLKKGSTISVMRKGKIWARTAANAKPAFGKKAYVVLTGEDAGKFTEQEATNLDINAVFGEEQDTGIAIVELR